MRQANLSYADLILEGATDGNLDTGPDNDSSCNAFIDSDGKIVAAIWWKLYNNGKLAWIVQAWTDKRYRRQGLYSRLHAAVCKRAKGEGAVEVAGNIHSRNVKMIAAAAKVGRVPTYVRYQKEL